MRQGSNSGISADMTACKLLQLTRADLWLYWQAEM